MGTPCKKGETHPLMREIVLDTETTGLDPYKGHRLVEIGCLELKNYIPTGKTFHVYVNPERQMTPEAFAVHGLSTEFLAKFSPFREVAAAFLSFIEDAALVIHNAGFDLKFLNAELSWLKLPPLSNKIIDTLPLARRKFPGSPANLDALCRRFSINNSTREKHGALVDAELLAQVYLELNGGRQPHLGFESPANDDDPTQEQRVEKLTASRPYRAPRNFEVSSEERQAHRALLENLGATPWVVSGA